MSQRPQQDRTFYEILGVTETCSADEIKQTYRKRATELHPDKGASPPQVAELKEITEAYNTLGNPSLRKEYDKQLIAERAAEAARKREQSARAEREKRKRDAAEADDIAEMFADNSTEAASSATAADSAGQAPPPPAPPKQRTPAHAASPPPPPALPTRKPSFNFGSWLGPRLLTLIGALLLLALPFGIMYLLVGSKGRSNLPWWGDLISIGCFFLFLAGLAAVFSALGSLFSSD